MRTLDHLKTVSRLYRESGWARFPALILGVASFYSFYIQNVASDAARARALEVSNNVLAYWYWMLIASLLVVIWSLYRQLIPRVDLRFDPKEGRFTFLKDGIRRFRVEAINYGAKSDDISFRVERILLPDGTDYPLEQRRGFQREAARGPFELSNRSGKYGHIAELDETTSDSPIVLLLHGLKEDDYPPMPMSLSRGVYFIEVGLNPPFGPPCYRTFRLQVSEAGRLEMEERSLPG